MNKSLRSIVLLIIAAGFFFLGKSFFMAPKYGGGEIAPNFSTTLMSGQDFSLEDLRGKYVLLDFWGTWCGPCRVEFPHLIALNKKYKNARIPNADGFEIVSVALEREGSEDRTKRAIDKLGLDWDYHIFDPITNFKLLNAEIATGLYGVREVPTKYLIAPDGSIMGVNMSFEEIAKTLDGK
jgi:thiol-disulfide isomerase/thioredoxin